MADIKTRDVTRGTIKSLDRAASSMHRMKEQAIRSKSLEIGSYRDNDSINSYDQDVTEHFAGDGATFATRAGVELIQRSRDKNNSFESNGVELIHQNSQKPPEIAADELSTDEKVHQAFREQSIKVIRDRQGRTKMADIEVFRNTEEYKTGDRIRIAGVGRQQEHIRRSRGVVAGYRLKSPKTTAVSNAATRKQREYGRRKLINEKIKGGSKGVIWKGNVRLTRKTAEGVIIAIKDLAKGTKAFLASLSAGGAAALLVVIVMILFGTAMTMTDDGNRVVGIGDGAIVEVARAELGNTGGEKYWKWYGFSSRVDWCAIFCSWCADQCGYIESGMLPKFSVVGDGANWFKARHRWAGRGYSPQPGDFIFFDYEQDGVLDHVGIVENCDGKVVTTIEGNSGDACKRNSYVVGGSSIAGYGLSVSMTSMTYERSSTWAKKIADDNNYHYVTYSGDPKTQECPVCNNHPEGKYRGWNCIGFAFACWRHGAGIPCNCNCSVINDGQWNQLLNCKTDAEADRLATRLVGVPCKVIRNDGDAIPLGKLKQGDIIALFNSSGYYHTMFYEGNGKAADCTSGRSDNIKSNNPISQSTKSKIKIAIRYGG